MRRGVEVGDRLFRVLEILVINLDFILRVMGNFYKVK